MELLLSGFIGALIATILSCYYFYLSEQKKLRTDVLLEAVAYFDDIYKHLSNLHTEKDAEYTGKKKGLLPEEYRIISRELTALLISSKPGVKLALVYGESDVMGIFNELRSYFCNISSTLRSATQSDWVAKHNEIQDIFENKIDPLRESFEKMLLHEVRLFSVIKHSFKCCFGYFVDTAES